MLRVGLSGGIGSGKSTVAAVLGDLGAVIIDSDAIAREVLAPGAPGLAEVVHLFGEDVLDAHGALDRPVLGRIVFADPSARQALEAITHPLIARRTAELVEGADVHDVVVHDVPLLVEKNMGPAYHLVVIVHSDMAQRIRRLVDERGMSETDAHARIRSQASDEARREAADLWVDNTAGVQTLRERVENLWMQRLAPYEHRLSTHTPLELATDLPIVPPDPTWPRQARRLVARLRYATRDVAHEITSIEHIGGTSIPQQPAADVIDIEIALSDPATFEAHRTALATAGFFEVAASTSARRLLSGSDPGRAVRVHVR